MHKSVRRVLAAAVISVAIYGGTWFWYEGTLTNSSSDNEVRPIAFADTIANDVNRRPAARLIWQNLNTGEPLYPGEAIRTGSRGQIRIRFPDSSRSLDLDPDSLIVINSGEKEIALDLMDGSVLVTGDKTDSTDGPALTLNSSSGKVDLSHSTASLSKSSKGEVDVSVIKGKVTGVNGETLNLKISEALEVIAPAVDSPLIMNADAIEPVRFVWKQNPTAVRYQLWFGDSPKELKNLAEVGNLSSLDRKIQTGLHFYKIVALDGNKAVLAESHTRRLEMITRRPPGPLAPLDNAYFHIGQEETKIGFQWSPLPGRRVGLEIATDSGFSNVIETQSALATDSFTRNLIPGEYYWRLSVREAGLEKPIMSKIFHFTVSKKAKTVAFIKWNSGIDHQKFFTDLKLSLGWTIEPRDFAKHWKLRIWNAELGREPASLPDEKPIVLNVQQTVQPVPKPGKYYAQVEAYNDNEAMVAKSEPQEVQVIPEPLLPAPEFEPRSGTLKAEPSGGLALQWTALKDVKEYKIRLMDNQGKSLKEAAFSKNSTKLVNLMPGEYRVQVYAVDLHGRESEKAEPRSVVVPDTSGLKAPKIKRVEIN